MAGHAGRDYSKSGGLRLMLRLPGETLPFVGFAVHIGTGDIGQVTLIAAAGIEQHDIVVLQRVGLFHAMGERAIGSEQCNTEVRAAGAHFTVGFIDEVDQFAGGDARAQYAGRSLLHPQSNIIGGLHQRDFRHRFTAAAMAGDRLGTDQPDIAGILLQAEE
ncbi:hypothetical protein D3C80_1470450 [compost metagenome]